MTFDSEGLQIHTHIDFASKSNATASSKGAPDVPATAMGSPPLSPLPCHACAPTGLILLLP